MGPCLCGDPYCRACGNHELLKLQEAQEDLLDKLVEANLTIEEYELFFNVGAAAITASRALVKKVIADYKADQEYVNSYMDDWKYNDE